MKKLLVSAVVAMLMVFSQIPSFAAIGDVWCIGNATNGWCFNSSGNLVPRSASLQAVGSASYPVSSVYSSSMVLTDAGTIPGQFLQGALATRSTATAAGAWTLHGAFNAATVTSRAGVAGTTADFSSTLNAAGQVTLGAIATRSTHTAAGALDLHGALSANGITSDAGVSGVNASFSGTLDARGATQLGAAATMSTHTSTGDLDLHGSLSANGVTSDAGVSGTNASFSGTLDVLGATQLGAAATMSTHTSAGNLDLHGSLSANGVASDAAVSGVNAAFSGTLDVLGTTQLGAAATMSTHTSAGNLDLHGSLSANGVASDAAVSGVNASFSGTLDVLGATQLGAAATMSTHTSTGNLDLHGSLSANGVASDAAVSGVDAAFTGTLDADGQSTFGAAGTVSTITTGGVATFATSVGVPTTGMVFVGVRTMAELLAATAVMGEFGICGNCTPVEVFISSAAGAPGVGGYSNAIGLQLD